MSGRHRRLIVVPPLLLLLSGKDGRRLMFSVPKTNNCVGRVQIQMPGSLKAFNVNKRCFLDLLKQFPGTYLMAN